MLTKKEYEILKEIRGDAYYDQNSNVLSELLINIRSQKLFAKKSDWNEYVKENDLSKKILVIKYVDNKETSKITTMNDVREELYNKPKFKNNFLSLVDRELLLVHYFDQRKMRCQSMIDILKSKENKDEEIEIIPMILIGNKNLFHKYIEEYERYLIEQNQIKKQKKREIWILVFTLILALDVIIEQILSLIKHVI